VTADPGEKVSVTIELPERTFQRWESGWRTVAGSYTVSAAHSIADNRLSATTTVS
jgi:beta-glucosidase